MKSLIVTNRERRLTGVMVTAFRLKAVAEVGVGRVPYFKQNADHQTGEIPIADFEKEYAFAGDKNAQFQLIKEAFQSGDEQKFEQALRTVLDARDSLRRGILDMLRDVN